MKYTEDIKRVKTIWTDEVIEYVMEQRARTHKKPTWGRIVRRLEQHYNITTTTKNLQNQLWKRKQEKEKKESENNVNTLQHYLYQKVVRSKRKA